MREGGLIGPGIGTAAGAGQHRPGSSASAWKSCSVPERVEHAERLEIVVLVVSPIVLTLLILFGHASIGIFEPDVAVDVGILGFETIQWPVFQLELFTCHCFLGLALDEALGIYIASTSDWTIRIEWDIIVVLLFSFIWAV